jgi:hypothetical protein
MASNLYYNTVTPLLHNVLKTLMAADEFKEFRLVGGTALSLHRGHRASVDIDLFTDAIYGSIDFEAINYFLNNTYSYVDTSRDNIIGFGKSYFVGESAENSVKLDVFYTDPFIDDIVLFDNIRLASVKEIIAMKLDVVSRGGRKKDFWDIHELMNDYNVEEMFSLHEKRHPYVHQRNELKEKFKEFENADVDFDPICMRGKYWELIKLDTIKFVDNLN